jgi:hypothetical protein
MDRRQFFAYGSDQITAVEDQESFIGVAGPQQFR